MTTCKSCKHHSKRDRDPVADVDESVELGDNVLIAFDDNKPKETVYTCTLTGQDVGIGDDAGAGCRSYAEGQTAAIPPALQKLLDQAAKRHSRPKER